MTFRFYMMQELPVDLTELHLWLMSSCLLCVLLSYENTPAVTLLSMSYSCMICFTPGHIAALGNAGSGRPFSASEVHRRGPFWDGNTAAELLKQVGHPYKPCTAAKPSLNTQLVLLGLDAGAWPGPPPLGLVPYAA